MAPLCKPRRIQRQVADMEEPGFAKRIAGFYINLRDPDCEVTGVGVGELGA